MKNKNIGKGILCLVVAAIIILVSSGYISLSIFSGMHTGRLVASIIIAVILIGAIIDKSIDGVIIFGGVLLKLLDKQLGLDIKIPVLIAVIILLLMAKGFFFSQKNGNRFSIEDKNGNKYFLPVGEGNDKQMNVVEDNGSYIYAKSRFNGMVKYINSDNFELAQIDSQFGGVELYFSNTKVPSGHAEVELNTRFSGVEIFVPKNWIILSNLKSMMGDVRIDDVILEEGEVSPVELTISGCTEYGGVKVTRI